MMIKLQPKMPYFDRSTVEISYAMPLLTRYDTVKIVKLNLPKAGVMSRYK